MQMQDKKNAANEKKNTLKINSQKQLYKNKNNYKKDILADDLNQLFSQNNSIMLNIDSDKQPKYNYQQ